MVAYESYLFELRHYIHYYETQQKLSFQTNEGKQQLADYKRRALDSVINDAYIKELAKQNNVTVTNQEVDEQIAVLRSQNRLGTTNQVFEDVLRDFWGWSLNDFKRSLRQQMLERKVVSKLDTESHAKIAAASVEAKSGASFPDVVAKYTDDALTKTNGGEYPGVIDKSNRDISAQITAAIFLLRPGDISPVVDTGYTLELIRLNAYEGGKAKASHIQVNLKDVNTYLDPLKKQNPARKFIKV